MSKRVYIAGPMRGIPYYNVEEFKKAAKRLRADGWDVISPVERDISNGFDASALGARTHWDKWPSRLHKENTVMHCCLDVIDAEAIYLLNGWEDSTGARAEKAIADWLELEVLYELG